MHKLSIFALLLSPACVLSLSSIHSSPSKEGVRIMEEANYNCTTDSDCAQYTVDDTYIYCCKSGSCLFTNGDCNLDLINLFLSISTIMVGLELLATPFVAWKFLNKFLCRSRMVAEIQAKSSRPCLAKMRKEVSPFELPPPYYPRARDSMMKTVSSSISPANFERRKGEMQARKEPARRDGSNKNVMEVFKSRTECPDANINDKPTVTSQKSFFNEQGSLNSSVDFSVASINNNEGTFTQMIVEDPNVVGCPHADEQTRVPPPPEAPITVRRNSSNSLSTLKDADKHKPIFNRQGSDDPDNSVPFADDKFAGWAERMKQKVQALNERAPVLVSSANLIVGTSNELPVSKHMSINQSGKQVVRRESLFKQAQVMNFGSQANLPLPLPPPPPALRPIGELNCPTFSNLVFSPKELTYSAFTPKRGAWLPSQAKKNAVILLSANNLAMMGQQRKKERLQSSSRLDYELENARNAGKRKEEPGSCKRMGSMPSSYNEG